ncbi:Spindle pole body protein [Plasmopara halstedii]|uniref:Spindle pole body protein n=1 Tax=Plasmopara halstedii TaxID=4781 RepID=A0A0P1AHC7_PLAHL|nr:Spindle pole body protein [Plasmopara halstedii]CEG40212.1 Spindle pole body protein [Plasmopara halstedii]|eukprot:XP_024576581.1 Spindle pole body protein [Plasmopara halstedii]
MAVHRIGIVKNKKSNVALAQRREVAQLLADGKEEKARIRVEGIIRDDFTIEGYEVLELLCELLAERANLIKTEADCPHDMREAVCTLIWSASRTEIPELAEVKKQFIKKYGHDFEAAAIRNIGGCVNERVVQKLSVQPPSAYLVINYMKEIAKEFKVDWVPEEVPDPFAPIPPPTGVTVMKAAVSGPDFAALYTSASPSYMPSLSSSKRIEETVGSAPVDASLSRRSVNTYTNQPAHYYTQPFSLAHNDEYPLQTTSLASYTEDSAAASTTTAAASISSSTPATGVNDSTPDSLSRRSVNTYTNQPAHYFTQPFTSAHNDEYSLQTTSLAASSCNEDSTAASTTIAAASISSSTPATGVNDSTPDFDELTARFERLRKRQDRDDQNNTSFTF